MSKLPIFQFLAAKTSAKTLKKCENDTIHVSKQDFSKILGAIDCFAAFLGVFWAADEGSDVEIDDFSVYSCQITCQISQNSKNDAICDCTMISKQFLVQLIVLQLFHMFFESLM